MKPLEKTINECETRLDEVRKIVQTNLLSRYGQDELRAAIREAEGACDDVAAILVPAVNQDGYEKQLTFMVKLVQRATNSQASWEMWIPATEKADLEGWVKDVKPAKKNLKQEEELCHGTKYCRGGEKCISGSGSSNNEQHGHFSSTDHSHCEVKAGKSAQTSWL